jgi:hypothetical protein
VWLALLSFFLNHSKVVVHDPESAFRTFFQTYLPLQGPLVRLKIASLFVCAIDPSIRITH